MAESRCSRAILLQVRHRLHCSTWLRFVVAELFCCRWDTGFTAQCGWESLLPSYFVAGETLASLLNVAESRCSWAILLQVRHRLHCSTWLRVVVAELFCCRWDTGFTAERGWESLLPSYFVAGETPASLLNVADCQLQSVVMRSIFSHPALDKPASELYQRSLDALRMGLDQASLSLAARVVPVKLPVANIFWARVRRKSFFDAVNALCVCLLAMNCMRENCGKDRRRTSRSPCQVNTLVDVATFWINK